MACFNCGGEGPHFVPPSLGEVGFYVCERKEEAVETRTRWSETGLRTARNDLLEHDVIFIDSDPEDNKVLWRYLEEQNLQVVVVDRGSYLMVSLVHTTGKAARRA